MSMYPRSVRVQPPATENGDFSTRMGEVMLRLGDLQRWSGHLRGSLGLPGR
jgi:hypothetical protein